MNVDILNNCNNEDFDMFITAYRTIFIKYGIPQIITVKLSELLKSCHINSEKNEYIKLFSLLFCIKTCCKIQCNHKCYYNSNDIFILMKFITLLYDRNAYKKLKIISLEVDYNKFLSV